MKKKRTKRRKSSSLKISDRIFRYSYPITSLFLIITVLFYPISLYRKSNRPLTTLRVPAVVRLYLPDPLEFPTIATSVLGAQTIDPQDIVKYINEERDKVGSIPLRMNTTLMRAARMRADIILKYQNFSHFDPNEHIELATVLPKLNYHFVYASENIGMGDSSARGFVSGFMHSTYHRENLLNPLLVDTGVAVGTGPYKQYYVNIAVQLFAIPAGKTEYLGYSPDEIQEYKYQLDAINAKLNPVVWTFGQLARTSEFSEDNHKKLMRKKEILDAIYALMSQEKPLANNHVALILEYNGML